jgi:hypothetical protein
MSMQLRRPIIEEDVVRIPLTRGFVAVIDVCDLPVLGGRNWSALVSPRRQAVYACRAIGKRMLLLHREIMNAQPHDEVDHRDGDGLNCRRSNLRFCTRSQNLCNGPLRSDNRAGLKGAIWDERSKKWRAELSFNGKRKHLGLFVTPEEAHAAYLKSAVETYGEFARKS